MFCWRNVLTVSDSTQCTPHSVCSKAFAPPNMNPMSPTRATFHVEISTSKDTARRNMLLMSVTCATFHLEMSALKEVASLNIPRMLVTRETSHREISALQKLELKNNRCISVTRETSHSSIGPCSPLAQLQSGERSRHLPIAVDRATLLSGENC